MAFSLPPPLEHANRLEFISKQAKGQQKKGKDRQRRYDELVAAANAYVKDSQVCRMLFHVVLCEHRYALLVALMASYDWTSFHCQ